MYRSLFLCSLMLAAAHASAGDSTLDAAIGGGLGGAAGAAIGNEVGGRDGAIIGGAIGGAAGAAVTTRPGTIFCLFAFKSWRLWRTSAIAFFFLYKVSLLNILSLATSLVVLELIS